jgi:peptidoglycan/xylan/chitin deacetylase (PgdA/CDA1 family)
MYHGVGQATSRGEEYYTVSEEAFAAQVAALRGRVASYAELLKGRAAPGSIVLTFDDGERSVYTHAFPLLREQGLSATVFVTTAWIDAEGYLSADEIVALRDAGWIIGAHGVTHRFLSDLPDAELHEELAASRDALRTILGEPVAHMSLPGGRESPRVLAAVRAAGYRSLCTSRMGLTPARCDPYRVRRMMVVRPYDLRRFRRIIDGDLRLYFAMRARDELLGAAKRLLGNDRYVALRLRAFALAERLRSRR